MYSKTYTGLILVFLLSCSGNITNGEQLIPPTITANKEVYFANVEAIPVPDRFKRIAAGQNSFGDWLRKINLKKSNTVYLYNGQKKLNQDAQFAVLDISVGDKNLQQCADAAMRLRAEYLYSIKKFDAIMFRDNDGKEYPFTPPHNPEHFANYLQHIFAVCGTASLSKQMHAVKIDALQPGDVLIRGGFPGHAVLLMDMAINNDGQIIYLLAQSYMPAQDIHILKNPASAGLSPWYLLNNSEHIETPEYIFKRNELKRW